MGWKDKHLYQQVNLEPLSTFLSRSRLTEKMDQAHLGVRHQLANFYEPTVLDDNTGIDCPAPASSCSQMIETNHLG